MSNRARCRASGALLSCLLLVVAACGDGTVEQATDDAATGESTTTTSETTPSIESTTTTMEATTTSTTEEPVVDREIPPAGTGVLTVDGVDIPFTIESCSEERKVHPATSAIETFAMRGRGMAEDREVFVVATTAELAGRSNDTFGYSYAGDPDDYETWVIVGTGGTPGEIFAIDGPTYTAGPVPFERIEGISVVEDVDPGPGSIRFTC